MIFLEIECDEIVRHVLLCFVLTLVLLFWLYFLADLALNEILGSRVESGRPWPLGLQVRKRKGRERRERNSILLVLGKHRKSIVKT